MTVIESGLVVVGICAIAVAALQGIKHSSLLDDPEPCTKPCHTYKPKEQDQ